MKGTQATKAGVKPATVVSPEANARAAVKSAPAKLQANHVGAGPIPAPRTPTVALPQPLKARLAPIVGTRAVETARLHTGPQAHTRTRAADARALADGADIYFAEGEYRPGTRTGDALIAHELAHVDQALRGLLHEPARKAQSAAVRNDVESAADDVGERVAAGADVDEQDRKRRESAKVEAGRIGARLALVPGDAAAKPGVPPKAKAAAKPGEIEAATPEGAPAKKVAGATDEEAEGATTAGAPKKLDIPIMRAPVLTLSRKEKARATGVQSRAHDVATTTATAPTPKENVDTAKAAVSVPQSESDARAARKIVNDLAEAQKPSPKITELCDKIRALIKEQRPADEQGVIDTRPDEVAKEAGAGVEGGVKKSVDDSQASYGAIDATPKGPQPPIPPAVGEIPAATPAPDINAHVATPDPVPADQVSLDADAEKMKTRANDAGLDKEAAKLVPSGPVADARDASDQLDDLAKTGPDDALKQQQEDLAQSNTDMAALQAKAVSSLVAARASHAAGVKTQRGDLKGGEEALRTDLAAKADGVYSDAQTRVQDLLRDVPATAMKKWTTGLPAISKRFNDDLDVVKKRVQKRHSGVSGWFVSGWDAVSGLPGWAKKGYNAAETNFGDSVCALITEISSYVNGIIKIADLIIADARTQITDIFTKNLPDGLKEWADGQQKQFGTRLDKLHDQAEETRTSFNKELIENAGSVVQAAREQVQELRKKAGGLWGRFLDALGKFLDDPIRFIINGLLQLVGISPPAFWGLITKIEKVLSDIVDAPLDFANNLMDGVGKGFTQFFDNITKHLIVGFLEWLLSGMKKDGVPIEVPKEFSLKSVVGFFLQLLGISWARIRKLLVEQLGEKNVVIIEKVGGVIYTLATRGIAGIFEDIEKMLEPQTIIDAIIDAAVKYLVETLIVKVAARIIAMLNPAGAILAAIEAIYRVLKWIFNNAARIFHFIEAVVNSMADVIAGNIAGVANMIEKALAMLIPPVIDFLADYLGLGGLPAKVATAVKGMQAWVEGVMRRVIAWLVMMGKKLLATLGFKGKDDKDKKKGAGGEVGERVPFSGGGESHTLFVSVSGSSATLMVASAPMTLEHWLDGLEKKIPELNEEDQKNAPGLLSQARGLLAKTDAAADTEAAAIQAAKAAEGSEAQAPAASGNEAVISDEEQLAKVLGTIAELFGEEHFAQTPRKIKVNAVRVPKPEFTEELRIALAKATGSTIHRGTKPDPKLAVKVLVGNYGADFNKESKVLTLLPPDGSELAAQKELAGMGERVATASGTPEVRFATTGEKFEITGDAATLSAKMAWGEVPGTLPDDQVVKVVGERQDVLLEKWTEDVVKSGYKALVRGKPDKDEVFLSFVINRQNATQGGVNLLKTRVSEKRIDTLELLRKEMAAEATRELFTKDAGEKVKGQVIRYGVGRATEDKVKSRIESKVDFVYNEQLGQLLTPGVDADHSEFYPIDIRETRSGGNVITSYKTKTGQSFTVTQDEKSLQVTSIEGENLSLKGFGDPKGRGVTQDSPGFVAGASLNRSHLIADEFKGSGYAASLNVISASEHYNQVVMRGAEVSIGDWLIKNDAVKFAMRVDVTWGDVIDANVLAEIKAADWYPKEYKTDTALDQAITAILAKTPDLKRCMGVEYTVLITEATPPTPAGKPFDTAIGADVWLLLEKK